MFLFCYDIPSFAWTFNSTEEMRFLDGLVIAVSSFLPPQPWVPSKTWQLRAAGYFLDGHVCLTRSQCPLPSAVGTIVSRRLFLSISSQRQMAKPVDRGNQRPVRSPTAIPTLMESRWGWRHTMLMMPWSQQSANIPTSDMLWKEPEAFHWHYGVMEPCQASM